MWIKTFFILLVTSHVYAADERIFCHFDFAIDQKYLHPAHIYIETKTPFARSARGFYPDKKAAWGQKNYREVDGIVASKDSQGNIEISLNFYVRDQSKFGYIETLNKIVKLNYKGFLDLKHYDHAHGQKTSVEYFCMKDTDLLKTVQNIQHLNKLKIDIQPERETITEMVDYMRGSEVGSEYTIPATKPKPTKKH